MSKVRIGDDLYVEMQKEAEKLNMTTSGLVKGLCTEFLNWKRGKERQNENEENDVSAMRKRRKSKRNMPVRTKTETGN